MLEKLLMAAEEHNADIVFCAADQYSEKNGTTKPDGWRIDPKKIPPTEDHCYNRRSNSAYLFQSALIPAWNKMIRSDLIKKYNIRAQSQAAANDVVLTCTALACAERIYPLYESLYIQRRDNDRSITSDLSSKDKHLCGYTASLGLLKELQRQGIYQDVRETYQRLAIHMCIWYLDKNFTKPDLFKRDYEFLQKEGFRNLDLENILPSVLYHDPDQDIEKFTTIQNGAALYEYFYARLLNEKRDHNKTLKGKNDAQRKVTEAREKIDALTQRINTLENTKSYRATRFLYTFPSKLKRKLTDLIVPKQRRSGQKKYPKPRQQKNTGQPHKTQNTGKQ